jgi:hypothetical protein
LKRLLVSSFLFSAIFVLPVAAHEEDCGKKETKQHNGPSVPLGSGHIRTYVVLGNKKDPVTHAKPVVELGLEFSESAMKSLPAEETTLDTDFPVQARNTPFEFFEFDWNPHGHEPAGIYDKPHFDFHFYTTDREEIQSILPGPCFGLACDVYDKARKPVPPEFLPQGYIDVGSVVPYMGNHLIDPTSPEFNGKLFTRTWLYGAYDGEIIFYEPMITRASLTEQPNQCTALKLPQAYEKNGYYPKKSCTEFDRHGHVYRISLKDFVYRTAPSN